MGNPETQRELPPWKPCFARISSRVTGYPRYRKVPLFWLLLAGGGVACRVLKIPEPDSCRQASRTPGRERARKCASWRPLTKQLLGTGLVSLAPVLCVVAGLLGRPWQDEICRARGSAPQTHAAGSRSRQACCAWSPRKAAESRSPISRAGACRFQSGGTARLASHQTRQAHAVWHAAPCETLMGWMPGASVKV